MARPARAQGWGTLSWTRRVQVSPSQRACQGQGRKKKQKMETEKKKQKQKTKKKTATKQLVAKKKL
jgi:hypothetical protein